MEELHIIIPVFIVLSIILRKHHIGHLGTDLPTTLPSLARRGDALFPLATVGPMVKRYNAERHATVVTLVRTAPKSKSKPTAMPLFLAQPGIGRNKRQLPCCYGRKRQEDCQFCSSRWYGNSDDPEEK